MLGFSLLWQILTIERHQMWPFGRIEQFQCETLIVPADTFFDIIVGSNTYGERAYKKAGHSRSHLLEVMIFVLRESYGYLRLISHNRPRRAETEETLGPENPTCFAESIHGRTCHEWSILNQSKTIEPLPAPGGIMERKKTASKL